MTRALQGATGVGNIVVMGFANGDMMRQNLDSSIGALEVSSSYAELCDAEWLSGCGGTGVRGSQTRIGCAHHPVCAVRWQHHAHECSLG